MTAHGASGLVGLPHSSPLMKLPMRPDAKTRSRAHGATKSVTTKNGCPMLRGRRAHIATSTPARPPWNDMPPSHTLNKLSGSASELAQAVDEHVADAAADDRAERDVEHDVVDVLRA